MKGLRSAVTYRRSFVLGKLQVCNSLYDPPPPTPWLKVSKILREIWNIFIWDSNLPLRNPNSPYLGLEKIWYIWYRVCDNLLIDFLPSAMPKKSACLRPNLLVKFFKSTGQTCQICHMYADEPNSVRFYLTVWDTVQTRCFFQKSFPAGGEWIRVERIKFRTPTASSPVPVDSPRSRDESRLKFFWFTGKISAHHRRWQGRS